MTKLQVSYDSDKDVLTIEGVRYTGDYFRTIAGSRRGPLAVVKGPFYMSHGLQGGVEIHYFTPNHWATTALFN